MRLNKLGLSKAIVLLIFLFHSGFPFQFIHKSFDLILFTRLFFSIFFFFIIFIYKKEFIKIKKSPKLLLSLILIIFSIIRPRFYPPLEYKAYDFWIILFGLSIILKKGSPIAELLRFAFVLASPVALIEFYNIPTESLQKFLLILVAFLFYILIRFKPKKTKKNKSFFILSLVLFTIFSLNHLVFDPGLVKCRRVVFDISHSPIESALDDYNTDLEHSVDFGHGRLVDFLKRFNYSVDFIKENLTSETLKRSDILVLIMCSKPYTASEVKSIIDFVKEGGGLLVIGDHTNIDDNMAVFNPIIERFGIRIRFDTIWLSNDKRGDDVIYTLHPAIFDLKNVHLSVGSSLDISSPARPLLMASYKYYSDAGNPDDVENAYLGNSILDKDERVGDIILAAVSEYGAGRVLVLGDSSYFQNSSLYQNYPFALRLFDWLNRRNSPRKYFLISPFVCILVLLVLILFWRLGALYILPYSFILSLIIATIISSNLNRFSYPSLNFNNLDNKILIDFSHNNEYGTYWTTRTHNELGIDSFIHQAVRLGLHPFIKEKGKILYPELKQYKVFITIAPNADFTRSEIESLDRYVKEGGSLLIIDGPRRLRGSGLLIKNFDLYLEKNPLGILKPVVEEENYYYSGLPVKLPYGDFQADFEKGGLTEAVEKIKAVNPCEIKGGEPFVFIYERPIAASLEYKKGKVILIGDDLFFANYVTESEEGVVDEDKLKLCWNILRWLKD